MERTFKEAWGTARSDTPGGRIERVVQAGLGRAAEPLPRRSGRVGRAAAAAVVVAAALAASGPSARADLIGLNPANYTFNKGDTGIAPTVGPDSIQLTTGSDQRRSVWFNAQQPIANFTAAFTYRANSISASAQRQGVTFALQNSPSGTAALGSAGSGYGYSGVTKSAAITIETDTGPARTYSGFYANGMLGGGSADTTPVNAFNPRDIRVTITYNGSVLGVTMNDGVNTVGPKDYLVGSLATTLGGTSAYVGFTGGTFNTLGSGGGSQQTLSNFTFTSAPEPSAAVAAAASVTVLVAGRRRRRAR